MVLEFIFLIDHCYTRRWNLFIYMVLHPCNKQGVLHYVLIQLIYILLFHTQQVRCRKCIA